MKHLLIPVSAFIICAHSQAGLGETGPAQNTVALLPLGRVKIETIEVVDSALEQHYGWHVRRLQPKKLPHRAFYKPRKRYRAEKILDWLHPIQPKGAQKIMAVTETDISTTKGHHKDWGICGLAEISGKASVISTYRIKRKLGRGSRAERQQRYLKRLAELAAHEFGHQLGLPHCPNRGCVMEDAKGTVTTFNRSTGTLCPTCKAIIRRSKSQ